MVETLQQSKVLKGRNFTGWLMIMGLVKSDFPQDLIQ